METDLKIDLKRLEIYGWLRKQGIDIQDIFNFVSTLTLLPNVIRHNGKKYEFDMFMTPTTYVYRYCSDSDEISGEDECPHLAALKLLKTIIENYGLEAIKP